jgi:hypothetical protein
MRSVSSTIMWRDKEKDVKEFKCHQDSELNYVARLYNDKIIVKAFLIGKCKMRSIKYFTYMDIYKLIEKELGYPVPAAEG